MREGSRVRIPALPGLIAGGLVVAGVALWMLVAKPFLVLAGVGAFGPGILRELGVLGDQDEFQRQGAHRAGYHAYLAGGFVAVLVVAGLEWESQGLAGASEWAALILVVLWLAWMSSALLAYWGARRTAKRVLLTFGSFWAVFVVATLVSELHVPADTADAVTMLTGVVAGIGIVAPFFVLAWMGGRWPRLTGVLLVAVSISFVARFVGGGSQSLSTTLLTQTLLVAPLAASAAGLLLEKRPGGSGGGDDDADDGVEPHGAPA